MSGTVKRPSRKRQFKNLMQHAGQKELTAKARLVLAVLWGFTDDDGACWPSHETIMEQTGLSESGAKAAVRELAKTHTVMHHTLRAPFMLGGRQVRAGRRIFLVLPLSRHTEAGRSIEGRLRVLRGELANDVSSEAAA